MRAEIANADAAPHGPDGPHYPGTCRALGRQEQNRRIRAGRAHALRIDMDKACERAGRLTWTDRKAGEIEADPRGAGDVVLARKDVPTSYHLAVTLDDHLQGVTLVTRGWDLFQATHVHRLLQALLGLRTPGLPPPPDDHRSERRQARQAQPRGDAARAAQRRQDVRRRARHGAARGDHGGAAFSGAGPG